VTNGDHWLLVHVGEATTFASFYTPLWFEEPLTLRAFRSLLSARRLFGVPDDQTLTALLAASLDDQQELTDQLGYQVRTAVEVLIQAIDRIDRDQGHRLLKGFDERHLYDAAVTLMMRVVFLLAAEERGLILAGNPIYEQHYALSPLRAQLQEQADRHGEEVLERRFDAWSRLLATFRALYGGIHHQDLRLPAYGGSLFDPDRYPFLEGRPAATSWRDTPADPLAIDNRTVLHLLRAIQILQVKVPGGGPAEARRLSFRALDVEDIGHVYEGLLDHTAVRATAPLLSLRGAKYKEAEIALAALEGLRDQGDAPLLNRLKEATGRTPSALTNGLLYAIPADDRRRWLKACENDPVLYHRVAPWAGLVRDDTHGLPVVIHAGSVFVTDGAERRTTGTHYTPKALTEPIVEHTLEPLVYEGPAEGWPEEQWRRRSAEEILALRVCDPAMGSGAFLVAACRYLADRLVEAWTAAEETAPGTLLVLPFGTPATGAAGDQPLPADPDERLVYARRAVAARCLFGVDKNPMAVEMAKLSLWLTTLDKDRPFTFLDHALRCGDTLLGLTSADQLTSFHLDATRGRHLHRWKGGIQEVAPAALHRATTLRERIAAYVVADARDAEAKARLLAEAEQEVADLRLLGDLLIGAALANAGKPAARLDDALSPLGIFAEALLDPATEAPARDGIRALFQSRSRADLNAGRPATALDRHPFHWPLAFPEVLLAGDRSGFDCFVGNPPFIGGQRITGILGTDYRDHLVAHVAAGRRGSADLCAYFFLRAGELLRDGGQLGMLATNTLSQGDTREVALDQLVARGFTIPRAVPSRPWPGTANLEVAHVWLRKGEWRGDHYLDDRPVAGITPFLSAPGKVTGNPHRLAANSGKSFIGSYVLGMGFVLTPDEARALIEKDPKNREVLFPYLNGEDLNSRPDLPLPLGDQLPRLAPRPQVRADQPPRPRRRRLPRLPRDH